MYTDRRFEDGLITITHSRNAAEGLGLTHHPGEGRVHGYTSALSVLIPVPGELIGEGGGFTPIRLASLVAFAAAAAYAYGICRALSVGRWGVVFVLAYLALDQNQIYFGMSGMETQIAVAVLLAGVYHVLRGDSLGSGVALGLAPLARPDFLIWVLPAYVALFLRDRARALRAAMVSALICLPWVLFATAYYGSPVPNTIIAKSQIFTPERPAPLAIGDWIEHIAERIELHSDIWQLFSPFLEATFELDVPLPRDLLALVAGVVLALAGIGIVASWRIRPFRAVTAYVALFVLYRVFFLPPYYFEWYYPPFVAAVIVMAGVGISRIGRISRPASATLAVALAAMFAIHIPFSFPLDKRVQDQIEDRVRTPLGEYLGEVVGDGETVTSESAGYIGYYSRATLIDFPGLTSPTAVAALGELPREARSLQSLIVSVQPDWAVLRPLELEQLTDQAPETAARYEVVREFRIPAPDLSQGGLTYLNFDTEFLVLRRDGL